jgi:hypothetical protein
LWVFTFCLNSFNHCSKYVYGCELCGLNFGKLSCGDGIGISCNGFQEHD